MGTVIDGKARSEELKTEIARRVSAFVASGNRPPHLTAILVGDDPASQVYVRNKEKACRKAGIGSEVIRLSADTSEAQLLDLISNLNHRSEVSGILVQLPLPRHIDSEKVVAAIDPMKDVDAFHAETLGMLVRDRPRFLPCTPAGVMDLLASTGIPLAGLEAVVVGRSLIVGRPLALLLLQQNLTVTVCHSRTRDLPSVVRRGDVVIAAVGRAEMIRGDWLKPGAVVIDVGINRLPDGRLVGDVAFDEALPVASAITPVPGGVGPMTIAKLLENVLRAAELQLVPGPSIK